MEQDKKEEVEVYQVRTCQGADGAPLEAGGGGWACARLRVNGRIQRLQKVGGEPLGRGIC